MFEEKVKILFCLIAPLEYIINLWLLDFKIKTNKVLKKKTI